MIDQGSDLHPWLMLACMLGMHLIANQTHNCRRANIVLRHINVFHLLMPDPQTAGWIGPNRVGVFWETASVFIPYFSL